MDYISDGVAERLSKEAANFAHDLLVEYRNRPNMEHLDVGVVINAEHRLGRQTWGAVTHGIYASLMTDSTPLELWEPVIRSGGRRKGWVKVEEPSDARQKAAAELNAWATRVGSD